MPTLIQFQKLSKSFGGKIIFDQAGCSIEEGEHLAVIGPNGAGKSTLFKMLVGIEEPDSGEIIKSRGLRIGYLPQETRIESELTTIDFMSDGATMPPWDIQKISAELGIDQAKTLAPLKSLSGGYRMRAALIKLLATEPDILLLDEPTNYLDLETLLVLERFLLSFRGTFMLISHDREFLRKICDHTLEVEGGGMTKYPGDIDDYFEQKSLLQDQLQARAMSVEAKRAEILNFVARFGAKATKARQAQSRLKQLDRLEEVVVKRNAPRVRLRIPEPEQTGREVCRFQSGSIGYGDHTIVSKINLTIERGDKIAIVGLNGAGKTTLLRTLAHDLLPRQGSVDYGLRVRHGYYAQHVAEALDPTKTVFQSLSEVTTVATPTQTVLDLAGGLLFSGDAIQKPVRVLSGGEKSRVALGQVLLSKAPLLFLDEPTNHLDFDTVEALTQALEDHAGTLVVVSHDRAFIRRVATKIYEIRDGTLGIYNGTYDDYVWSLRHGALKDSTVTSTATDTTNKVSTNVREPSQNKLDHLARKQKQVDLRNAERRVEKIEKDIARLEGEKHADHEFLDKNPTAWTKDLGEKITKRQESLDELESEWLDLIEKISTLKKELE